MLSLVRFLHRLLEYTGTPQCLGCTLACDNLSLVSNVTATTQYSSEGEIPELFLDDEVDPDTVFHIASFT